MAEGSRSHARYLRHHREERFSRGWALRDQLRRAAVSVMSNIGEGFERGGAAEFYRFLVIAKTSCAEVRSQLYVAHDAGYIDTPCFHALHARLNELARILGGRRAAVAKQRTVKA